MSNSQPVRLGDQRFGDQLHHGPVGHGEGHTARANDELLRARAGEGGQLFQTGPRSPSQGLPGVVVQTLLVQRPARGPSLERAKPSRQILLVFSNQRVQPDGEPDRARVPAPGFRQLPERARSFDERIHGSLPYGVPAGSVPGHQPKHPVAPLSPFPDRGPAGSIRKLFPSWVNGPSANRPATTSTDSSSIANRSPVGASSYPKAPNSGSYQPAPSPRSKRPPLIRSMAVAIFATWAG